MKKLDSRTSSFAAELDAIIGARQNPGAPGDVTATVHRIIADVRDRGDEALVEYTRKFDRSQVSAGELLIDRAARKAALAEVGPEVEADLRLAAKRIEVFHRRQKESSWSFETEDGIRLAQRVVPLRAVGVYVPGGTASYPSSVLMNVIPARVAGVDRIVMVTPAPDDELAPVVLAAAEIAGVDEVVRVGGAQAVAALAYGTERVPRVDKIVGPGNQWVAEAKRQVFGRVDIDMIAGPSELCVVATRSGGATVEQLAADLLSQAEHDTEAMVSLLSDDETLIDEVMAAVERQAAALPRAAIAQASIADYGVAILVGDIDEAMAIAERIAPEHLELVLPDADARAETVRNAGAVFCGPHTPEAIGDYLAGPNHVLPTNGTARFSSPLGVYDFVKRLNVIRFSRAGLQALGPVAARLADLEGLTAHAESVRTRLRGD
ncbi:MAG: histidinol dehydrogenase [Myxococcota bacterium]